MTGYAPGVRDAQDAANFLEASGPYGALVCVSAVAAWLAWQWTKSLEREREYLLKFPEFAAAQREMVDGVTESVNQLARNTESCTLALGKVETRLEALK